jgi:acetylornithine deacetylase
MSDVVEILRQLVSISSVSCESNRPLVSFAGGLLANAGWSSQEHAYFDSSGTEKVNLIAWPAALPPDNKTVELALVCHTDTIPYAASWTEATTPIVAGENLKGCGACDVKGFLACILAVVGRIDARQL